jgi:hypothetical protein
MVMFPGAICKSQGRTYLAIYSHYSDIFTLPSADMSGLERIAHVSYSKGGNNGGIDYFQLTEDRNPEEVMRVNKTIERCQEGLNISPAREEKKANFEIGNISYQRLKGVDKLYDIQYQLKTLPPMIEQEVLSFAQVDILTFCDNEVAKNPRGTKRSIVRKIHAKTQIKIINPFQYLRGGKQWFVPECMNEANIDFGQGCITGFVPIDNSWKFDGEYFHNLFSMPSGECEYCYAERQHRSFPKTIYKFDKQQLKEELLGGAKLGFQDETPLGRPVGILRFGKRTESWTPFTEEQFIGTLEACVETGTHCIIPTKFLPYSKEIADLLKKTNSSLLYSIGWDEIEKGACMWGTNNQWRLDQALKYKQAGVNSNIYFLIIGHHPPSERETNILNFADFGRKLPIQLLPLRFQGKELMTKLTGDEWNNLISKQGDLFEEQPYRGSYVKERQAILLKKFDPFWTNLAKNSEGRIRICHHNDKKVYCGRCFQGSDAQNQLRNKNKKQES